MKQGMEQKKNNRKNSKAAWLQFKKNRIAYYSYKTLLVLLVIATIAPFIATDQPLYCKYKGKTMFPAFSFSTNDTVTDPLTGKVETLQYDIVDWKHLDAQLIFAPVAYAPSQSDYDNSNYVGPADKQVFVNAKGETEEMPAKFRHWLGTNKAGEDVLSGLINGTRVSLLIGILSMSIASFIGILLGGLAGYFGDKRLQTCRGSFWTVISGLIVAFYYGFLIRSYIISDALMTSNFQALKELVLSFFIFSLVLCLFFLLGKPVSKLPFLNKPVYIPIDSIVSRTIEILISMPLLILIISISAIAREKSIINVMVIIGLTSWTGIARLTRAEFLRVSTLDYIQSAKALGFKELRIVLKHALPNAVAPAFVAIAFGIASAILIESSLSFLGIGVPPNLVTWGSLLNSGREQYHAWWLVIFPGLAIFITVTVYNLLGEGLRDALDPKLRE
jgi:peptide/nickel transport system permease protein